MINIKVNDYTILKYIWTGLFSEGLVAVRNRNNLYGFMDSKGKEIVPCKYIEVKPFKEGLAAVKNSDGFWGYINKEGQEVIPCQYTKANSFSEGLASVEVSPKNWIYIDEFGNKALNEIFECAEDFSDGYAIVKTLSSQKYHYMDKNGDLYGPYVYPTGFKNGIALVADENNIYTINTLFEIINKKNRNSFKDVYSCFEDTIKVKDNCDFIGYLDSDLNEKIPCVYKQGRNFSDGVAIVTLNYDFLGFVSKKGKTTTFSKKLQYKTIHDFHEGLAAVENPEGFWGYINKEGKEVIPCQYTEADDFSEGLAGIIDIEGNIHYINKRGTKKLTIPTTYYIIVEIEDRIISIKAKDKKTLNDQKMKVLSEIKKQIINDIDQATYDATSGAYEESMKRVRKPKNPKNNLQVQ